MADTLQIEGKTLHAIKDAAQVVSYSRDYVTRLAREEKIDAQLVGRQWFVDVDSLRRYAELSAMEQELRKKQLSEERKRERLAREAAERQHTLTLERAQPMHFQAAAVASLVLGFGLLTGWGISFLSSDGPSQASQNVAQVSRATEPAANFVAQPSETSVPTPVVSDPDMFVPEFSGREVSSMEDGGNGVLLFPNATSTAITELFSDEVEVVTLPNGERVVWRIDNEGNRVGNPLLFVEVPVNPEMN